MTTPENTNKVWLKCYVEGELVGDNLSITVKSHGLDITRNISSLHIKAMPEGEQKYVLVYHMPRSRPSEYASVQLPNATEDQLYVPVKDILY